MSESPRYGIFKVFVTCTHCGDQVIVNGPQSRPVCGSCQKQVSIPPESWKSIFDGYEQEYNDLEPGSGSDSIRMGAVSLKYGYVKLPPPTPACPGCQTDWELTEVANGHDGNLFCQQCGRKTPTFPPPPWLKAVCPTVSQIFFGDRDVVEGAGEAVVADEAATQPIALACPKCNGGLTVTAQTERTMKCSYCGVDVYLPDGVWQKLHPAKVAKYWLVRFEG